MAGASGAPTQGNAGSNVFSVPTQMQNQQVGTLLGGNNSQPLNQSNLQSQLTNNSSNVGNLNQSQGQVPLGGKGVGMMQPQQTAMGTPIVYGNTYLPQSQAVVNRPVITPSPVYTPNFYEAADGTTSVPEYAYGTTSVANYAKGTTGVDEDDPWNWTTKEQVAPLVASIKPSEAVTPQAMPDKTEQFLGQQAMGIGTNAAAKGIEAAYKAYNAPLTTQAVSSLGTTASGAPVALGNVGALTAPAASAMPTAVGAMATPMTGALVPASGLGSVAGAGTGLAAGSVAPIGAGIGSSIGTGLAAAEGATLAGAGTAAATGAAATGAGAAGLGGALGAGGSAAMAALASNPGGWVIGAGLLAKKLKIF